MLSIAGQTAGPNGPKIMGGRGVFKAKKIQKSVFKI